MFLVDTNILISEILSKFEKDETAKKYRGFYQRLALSERVITDFILNELETYMIQVVPSRYKLKDDKKKEMNEITRSFLKSAIRTFSLDSPSPAVIKMALSWYEKFFLSHPISFTDSLLLALAQDRSYTLLTQDKRLIACARQMQIQCVEL